MYTIDAQTTSATFTPATTLEEVTDGVAGYAYIQNADVWCQIQTMHQGQSDPQWTIPLHIPQGGCTFGKGRITGLRFWSYGPTPAIVSAAIFVSTGPQLTLGSYGIA
jgi:hypothetical protein